LRARPCRTPPRIPRGWFVWGCGLFLPRTPKILVCLNVAGTSTGRGVAGGWLDPLRLYCLLFVLLCVAGSPAIDSRGGGHGVVLYLI